MGAAMAGLTLEWSDLYAYTMANVNIYVPKSAGVYKLYSFIVDRRQVFYVGQAENLNREIWSHLSDVERNACIRSNIWYYSCYFQFASLAAQSERDCAERALYDHYRPPCNIIPPVGEPCEINFD